MVGQLLAQSEHHGNGVAQLVGDGGEELVPCLPGLDHFGHFDQSAFEVHDLAHVVANRPRGVLDPHGRPVRAFQFHVEVVDDARLADLFEPAVPIPWVHIEGCRVGHFRLHLLHGVETEKVGHRRVGGQKTTVGGGAIERHRHPSEQVSQFLDAFHLTPFIGKLARFSTDDCGTGDSLPLTRSW